MNSSLFIRAVTMDWQHVQKNSYLRKITALNQVKRIGFEAPVTFFVGENGSGKSTLLEAMAVAAGFNPEGGTKNYHFSTHADDFPLYDALRLTRSVSREKSGYFLRAESFFNVATQEEEYADAAHPSARYHQKSHGESFLALAQAQLNPGGLFFLDEPEAALSPQRQLSLLADIFDCAKGGAQFFVVTHSPILLGLPGAQILTFDRGKIHPCAYEETGSYQITEMFINHRAPLLGQLIGTDE